MHYLCKASRIIELEVMFPREISKQKCMSASIETKMGQNDKNGTDKQRDGAKLIDA